MALYTLYRAHVYVCFTKQGRVRLLIRAVDVKPLIVVFA